MENTKVLTSFGAALGGFELAWAIKHDLDQVLGKDAAYLDAVSLSDDVNTHYDWLEELGIWKMGNANWETHFKNAMSNCKVMIFIITEEWLNSYYCWKEFELFMSTKEKRDIKPFFLVTEEALEIIQVNEPRTISLRSGETIMQDLNHLNDFTINKAPFFISQETAPGGYDWHSPSGRIYHYNTKYALTAEEFNALTDNIIQIVTQ